MQLITERVVTDFNPTGVLHTHNYGGGPHKIEIPQSSVNMAKPLSYEFRVAEYLDESGAISKVGLQIRIWEHTNINGNGFVKEGWKDVERVQIPFIAQNP